MTKPRSVASTANDNSIPGSRIENDSVTATKLDLQAGDIPGSIIEDGTITDATISPTAAISASKLNFLQAGTSAVARSIESKLKDTVSIKDFGAVGDGSDATVEIQAAVNTGSAVIVPPGEYLVSSTISVPSNTQIIGLGGTIVRAPSPLGLVLFSTNNTENVAFNNARFKVAEGTSTAQSGGFIGANYCNFFRVENCVFDGEIPGATGSKESLFSAVNSPNCNNMLISGNQFRYINGNACGAQDGVGNSVNGNNVSIVNNLFYNIVDTGVGNWTNARNVTIVGNVFNRDDYSTSYNGVHIDVAGATCVTITGNEFHGNTVGVRVLSNLGYRNRGILVSSNVFANQVPGSSELGIGVRIPHYTNGTISNEDSVTVVNNHFLIGNGSLGIDVVSTVVDTTKPLHLRVDGNTFDIQGTSAAGVRFQRLGAQGAIRFTPGKNTYNIVNPGSSSALAGQWPNTLSLATYPEAPARRTNFTVTTSEQLDEYYIGPGFYAFGVGFGTCTDTSGVGGILRIRDEAGATLPNNIVVSSASSDTKSALAAPNYVQSAGFYNTHFSAHPSGHNHQYRFLQIQQLL